MAALDMAALEVAALEVAALEVAALEVAARKTAERKMTGGTEWLVDAFGCDPLRLSSAAPLLELSATLIATLGLHVVGEPLVHRFGEPSGVTGLYLLSESHLAWHTYPESLLCTFNLYCCRACPTLDWSALLGEALGARRVRVEVVLRGLGSSSRAGSGT